MKGIDKKCVIRMKNILICSKFSEQHNICNRLKRSLCCYLFHKEDFSTQLQFLDSGFISEWKMMLMWILSKNLSFITNEFKYISTKKFIVFLYHSVSVDICVAYFKRHSYFSEFMKIRNLQIHKTVYFQV